MKRRYSKRKLIIIGITLVILGSLMFLLVMNLISDFLSKTKKVNANLLLVEGWVQPYALEMASSEYSMNGYDLIITTGLDIPEYYSVYSNGYLIFYPNIKVSGFDRDDNHSIEVKAYSESGGKHSAHFNFFVNDILLSDFNVGKIKRAFKTWWHGKLTQIDSLIIQFDNDGLDKNLFIKEIVIDNNITIKYQNNSVFDILALDNKNRINNHFTSSAEKARNELLAIGVDSSSVIAIPENKSSYNRTLSSALAFRDWLKVSNLKVKGINIVSVGTHARRTWMTYTKVLGKAYDIGIISLPDDNNHNSKNTKIFRTVRETLGIIYYWIILMPY
jgi:hypothetical protein